VSDSGPVKVFRTIGKDKAWATEVSASRRGQCPYSTISQWFAPPGSFGCERRHFSLPASWARTIGVSTAAISSLTRSSHRIR
jgi:hypothetical protein